jgi:hypothetical protein
MHVVLLYLTIFFSQLFLNGLTVKQEKVKLVFYKVNLAWYVLVWNTCELSTVTAVRAKLRCWL